MNKYPQPGPPRPIAFEHVDEDGKRHRGFKHIQPSIHAYNVHGLEGFIDHRVNPETFVVTLRMFEEDHDLQFTIPLNMIGEFMAHMFKLSQNFDVKPTELFQS